jgi:hypothetical protein
MNRRIFIGIDPGTKGACAVTAVADCPADEAMHGRVLAVEVFDLPVVERDNGGHDFDVVTFNVALRTALRTVVGDMRGTPVCVGLVEYPILTAGFGGSVRSKTQQGVNAGAVWAAMKATGLVQVAWVDSDKWRAEVDSQKGCEFIEAASVLASVPPSPEIMAGLRASGDRCIAVLLAEVARRRWLGTAVAPKKTGTARAAKARKADRRKEAIARAVAPLTVAKARVLAVRESICLRCVEENGKPCSPRRKCCDSRLLGWASSQKPDLVEPLENNPLHRSQTVFGALLSMTTGAPLTIFAVETWSMRLRTSRSKDWTVTGSAGGEWTIPRGVGDTLIDHGIVQIDPGEGGIVYRPTWRGFGWSSRLRVDLRQKEAAKP